MQETLAAVAFPWHDAPRDWAMLRIRIKGATAVGHGRRPRTHRRRQPLPCRPSGWSGATRPARPQRRHRTLCRHPAAAPHMRPHHAGAQQGALDSDAPTASHEFDLPPMGFRPAVSNFAPRTTQRRKATEKKEAQSQEAHPIAGRTSQRTEKDLTVTTCTLTGECPTRSQRRGPATRCTVPHGGYIVRYSSLISH